MASALEGEEFLDEEGFASADRRLGMETDHFFVQTEWIGAYADVIPSTRPSEGKRDAVVMAIAPMDIEEGLRIAIDHGAVFSSETCRRIWIVSDNWVLGESFRYQPHVQALKKRGFVFRYILVTPWGWTEIPFTEDFECRQMTWVDSDDRENTGSGYSSSEVPRGRPGREDNKK